MEAQTRYHVYWRLSIWGDEDLFSPATLYESYEEALKEYNWLTSDGSGLDGAKIVKETITYEELMRWKKE